MSWGSDVGQVGSDLRVRFAHFKNQGAHSDGVDNVVEGELGDQGVELQEQGEGLTDSTCTSDVVYAYKGPTHRRHRRQ